MSLNATFLCMVLLKPLKELGFAPGPGERETPEQTRVSSLGQAGGYRRGALAGG